MSYHLSGDPVSVPSPAQYLLPNPKMVVRSRPWSHSLVLPHTGLQQFNNVLCLDVHMLQLVWVAVQRVTEVSRLQ